MIRHYHWRVFVQVLRPAARLPDARACGSREDLQADVKMADCIAIVLELSKVSIDVVLTRTGLQR